MGIGWTLQEADAVNSAREPVVSMPDSVFIEGGLDSVRVFARFANARRAVLKRTFAKG